MKTAELLDFNAPELLNNPYNFYENIRDTAPVYQHENGAWYLSSYQDVANVLSNKRILRKHPQDKTPFPLDNGKEMPFDTLSKHWIVFEDGERHAELRTLFSQAFTSEKIKQLEQTIQTIVESLIQDLNNKDSQRIDIVSDFTYPLTIQVICHMLGTPENDWPRFKNWAAALTEGVDHYNPDMLDNTQQATIEITNYFKSLLPNKRQNLTDDLMSMLITANIEDKALSDDEIAAISTFFIWAGHETTKNLIGNGLMTLQQHPQQFAQLKQQPELLSSAIEEILRYESPIQKTHRWVNEDIIIGDQKIPTGSMLVLLIGAANRDPQKFPETNFFDIRRTPNQHLSFGRGVHHCLGAMLARLEARIAYTSLFKAFPNLEVDINTLNWKPLTAFRALESLTISLDAGDTHA